jgi:hypothetical protein
MVPRLTTILQRFTTEWTTLVHPEAMLAVCSEVGYTGWRKRVLTPVTTMQLLLLQILQGNTVCSHRPHLSGLRCSAAAYCQAHAKLPRHFFALLLERVGSAVQVCASDDGRWQGHRPCVIEGSGGSMPESAGPPPGCLRPIDRAAARVRLSHGPPLRAVPCGPRRAPDAGGRAPPDPRPRPGAVGTPGGSPR